MPVSIANITVDCADTERVATFWAAALDRPLEPGGTEWMHAVGGVDGPRPRWLFLKVPEPRTAKNRMHLDLESDDREAEVERLVGIGATRIDDHDEYGVRWTVLHDPEGNVFCVSGPHT